MDPSPPAAAGDLDALHRALTDLASLVRFLPPGRRDEFRKPLDVVLRESSRLRRERDNHRLRAALLTRLVRYQAEDN